MIKNLSQTIIKIERWGRGTNRVAEMCRAANVAPPEFEEITGAAVVTFRVPVAIRAAGTARAEAKRSLPGAESGAESRAVSQPESRPESRLESDSPGKSVADRKTLADKVLALLAKGPLSRSELSRAAGQRIVSGQLNVVVKTLLARKLIEYTMPEKLGSRLQKYRLVQHESR